MMQEGGMRPIYAVVLIAIVAAAAGPSSCGRHIGDVEDR